MKYLLYTLTIIFCLFMFAEPFAHSAAKKMDKPAKKISSTSTKKSRSPVEKKLNLKKEQEGVVIDGKWMASSRGLGSLLPRDVQTARMPFYGFGSKLNLGKSAQQNDTQRRYDFPKLLNGTEVISDIKQ